MVCLALELVGPCVVTHSFKSCMVFLALELAGPWVVLGFSVSMEAFDELLSIMFPGVRSSLVFSGFGLEPPASGFQSYSYSSLKTSPSIQHQ